MKDFDGFEESLAGSLLLSHPALLDPNFRRSVVLISSHTREEGAFGAILNRPKGVTLGEVDAAYSFSPLSKVPLYEGGPVRSDEVILGGWRWEPFGTDGAACKLYFGIDPDQARVLMEEENFLLRAFLGYAGWGEGQLEEELRRNSWLMSPLDEKALDEEEGPDLWRLILRGMGPEMRLLADTPDDPEKN